MASEPRAGEVLDVVARYVPFDLSGRLLLELGSGVGAIQAVAQRRGIRAYGIEPSELGVQAAQQLLRERGLDPSHVAQGVAEDLKFPDGTFDVVCSSQVLEHVRDPRQVMAETVRVLRSGGYFVHIFPNYGSFWEGHYGVPWLPHAPKSFGRVYVKLLGRDLAMMDELQLVSQQSLARIMRGLPQARVVNWGFDLWEYRLMSLDFSEWAQLGTLKRWVRQLHRWRLVWLLVQLGRILHFETPIVLVGVKL